MLPKRRRTISRWLALASVVVMAVAGLLLMRGVGSGKTRSPGEDNRRAILRARNSPARIGSTWASGLSTSLDPVRVQRILERLRLNGRLTLPELLHALRLFGPDAMTADRGGRPTPVLGLILDHHRNQAYFAGLETFFSTRHGVQCRIQRRDATDQPERQAHIDQLLATFAESGVQPATPLRIQGEVRSVADLLNDALANFELRQGEVEWSALAFALYLPPQRSWRDKFGRETSFDDVVQELIARFPLDKLACGGTHILFSLVMILRADEVQPILSPGRREALSRFFRSTVAQAVSTQAEAGFWSVHWRKDQRRPTAPPANPETVEEILVTGHQIEWMIYLPESLAPARDTVLRAAPWLADRLERIKDATIQEHYCPCSHAGRVLAILAPTPVHPQVPIDRTSRHVNSGKTVLELTFERH